MVEDEEEDEAPGVEDEAGAEEDGEVAAATAAACGMTRIGSVSLVSLFTRSLAISRRGISKQIRTDGARRG